MVPHRNENEPGAKFRKGFCNPMKSFSTIICLLACGLGMTAWTQTSPGPAVSPVAAAAPAGPSRIAVIAFRGAVAHTNEGLRNVAQIKAKFEPRQARLNAQKDEIESLRKALASKAGSLSEQDRAAQARAIDEKQKLLKRSFEDAKNDFEREESESYHQLSQKVYEVVQNFAQQNGYTVVIDASTNENMIMYASKSTDITTAIIQTYNAKSGVPAPVGGSPPAPRHVGSINPAPTPAPKATTPK